MIAADGTAGTPTKPEYIDRVAVKNDGRVFFLRTDEIDYVESAANYARLHVGTQSHLIRETLTNLSARLDPSRFSRIHRTTIVNLDRVKEVQPWFSGDAIIILKTGQKLRLSRVFRSNFEMGTRSQL